MYKEALKESIQCTKQIILNLANIDNSKKVIYLFIFVYFYLYIFIYIFIYFYIYIYVCLCLSISISISISIEKYMLLKKLSNRS